MVAAAAWAVFAKTAGVKCAVASVVLVVVLVLQQKEEEEEEDNRCGETERIKREDLNERITPGKYRRVQGSQT